MASFFVFRMHHNTGKGHRSVSCEILSS